MRLFRFTPLRAFLFAGLALRLLAEIFLIIGQVFGGPAMGRAPTEGAPSVDPVEKLYQEGRELEIRGDYTGALTKYEASLKRAQSSEDKRAVAKNWLGIGYVKMVQGNYPKALELCEQAERLGEELNDPSILAETSVRRGNIQERKGQFKEARKNYEKALQIGNAGKDQTAISLALHNLGNVWARLGDYPQARTYYQRALQMREYLDDKRGIASTVTGIGFLYQLRGQYGEAIAQYQRALKISEEIGDKNKIASTLNNMGVVYARQGRYEEGVTYYQRALKIMEELGDQSGIAQMLVNLGSVYQNQGSYAEAVARYQRALDIADALREKNRVSGLLNNIGALYWSQGLYAEAAVYFQRALKSREEQGDQSGMAETLNNLGAAYAAQGSYAEAVAQYKEALKRREALDDKRGMAMTLHNIAIIYGRQESYDEAARYYEQALKISRPIHAKSMMGHALHGLGKMQRKRGNPLQAVETLQQALALGEEIKEPPIIWQARYDLARAYEELGDTARALSHYQAAVTEIEKVRPQAGSDMEKAGFLASKRYAYEDLIRFLYQLEADQPAAGYGRQAFEYAERAKARAFLDLMEESKTGINIKTGVDPDLLQRERARHARLSQLQARLSKEYAKAPPDPQVIGRLEKEQAEEYRNYEALQNEIRRRHPRYAELKYPQPTPIEKVQSLLDEQTVVLEYLTTGVASFLFVLTRTDYKMYRLAKSRGDLEELIREKEEKREGGQVRWFTESELERLGIRQALMRAPDPTQLAAQRQPEYYSDHYRKRARQLYRILIEPAESMLAGKKQLIIVPDGMLAYLPFEVLLAREIRHRKGERLNFSRLPYLIRDYSIHYAPSASVWASLRNNPAREKTPPKELLAFADPVYSALDPIHPNRRAAAHHVSRACESVWSTLPYSRAEVTRIAQLFPPGSVVMYLGAEAREENVKREKLEDYRRIHFAVHGCLNEKQPQFSALVLSPGGEGGEDGYLQLYEIFNLRMQADLVVLSACVTGLGREVQGEGIIGLTRGFLYAGAPSVVASLWNVKDFASAEFMELFYRNMRQQDKAEALRAAKLAIIRHGMQKSPYFSHPSFWSAFVLIGDWK